MDLSDGSVIDGFESSDPSLVFATHHMNAWEEGEEVVFDLATNPWDMLATYLEVYICSYRLYLGWNIIKYKRIENKNTYNMD